MARQDDRVMVQVSDSGPGIPQTLRADLSARPSVRSGARALPAGWG
ncbi:hypothetical protein M8494_17895 [Serratia ureilytica]